MTASSCTFSSRPHSEAPATSSTIPGSQRCSLRRSAEARVASARRSPPVAPSLSTLLIRRRWLALTDRLSRLAQRAMMSRGSRLDTFRDLRQEEWAAEGRRAGLHRLLGKKCKEVEHVMAALSSSGMCQVKYQAVVIGNVQGSMAQARWRHVAHASSRNVRHFEQEDWAWMHGCIVGVT